MIERKSGGLDHQHRLDSRVEAATWRLALQRHKAALIMMTRNWPRSSACHNIRVNAIAPD